MMPVAHATCPVTCGEFVQGVDADGPFLVSCPIDLVSSAVCTRVDSPAGIRVIPSDRDKTAAALRLLSSGRERDLGLTVELTDAVPLGRGYGTSTADIAVALAAAAMVLSLEMPIGKIGRIATGIEPTDGSFAPGLVVFDHVHGERLEMLGAPPCGYILVADPGQNLATTAVHRNLGAGSTRAEARAALEMVRAGIAEQDLGLIGKGSTLSARMNQIRLPNPLLEPLVRVATRRSGAGVVVAHSGTIAGVLFADPAAAAQGRARAALTLGPSVSLRLYRLFGGGVDAAMRPPSALIS